MPLHRKEIAFDLDINKLGIFYKDYRTAYKDLQKIMTKEGFLHRQGSGDVEKLNIIISDIAEKDQILSMIDCFLKALNPLRIYLFGSFANGTQTPESDYDFYIVVDDESPDNNLIWASSAYKSLRKIKNRRPVDILVNTNNNFNKYKLQASRIENEISKKD